MRVPCNAVYSCIVAVGGEQPLQFKPAPENLISKVAVENQEASMSANEGDLKENASGLYVPPRVMAMPYKDTKVQKLPEKTKLISELRDELTDFPTEVHVSNNFNHNNYYSALLTLDL